MITVEQARALVGAQVQSEDGTRLGAVQRVLFDDATGKPEWAQVSVGHLHHARLVPLSASWVDEDRLLFVPLPADLVRGAPQPEGADRITADEGDRLYRHYGLEPGSSQAYSSASRGTDPPGEPTGPRTSDAPLHRQLDSPDRTGAHAVDPEQAADPNA